MIVMDGAVALMLDQVLVAYSTWCAPLNVYRLAVEGNRLQVAD
jgi:hypothetical protein